MFAFRIPRLSHAQPRDRRRTPRTALCLRAVLDTGATTLDCVVVDLALNGARLQLDTAPGNARPCIGQQVMLVPPGRAPIGAVLRWGDGCELGLQFLTPITPEILTAIERVQGRVVRSRPGRARIVMPAELQIDQRMIGVSIGNLSCGGALIEGGEQLAAGAAVMLHSDLMRPVAGHIRWAGDGRMGLMFNRLLPIASAEAVARAFGVSNVWVDEVRTYHGGCRFDERYEQGASQETRRAAA